MTDAAGSIGGKVGFACSALWANLFHNESLVLLNSKSGIPGGDSELCPTSKGISCGSILSATEMSDSGQNLLFGSSILLLLSDWFDFSLFLNNRYQFWVFPISCALISERRSLHAVKYPFVSYCYA